MKTHYKVLLKGLALLAASASMAFNSAHAEECNSFADTGTGIGRIQTQIVGILARANTKDHFLILSTDSYCSMTTSNSGASVPVPLGDKTKGIGGAGNTLGYFILKGNDEFQQKTVLAALKGGCQIDIRPGPEEGGFSTINYAILGNCGYFY